MSRNKALVVQNAHQTFSRYNSILSTEFRAACEQGCQELDTLAKTVASVSDMKAYRAVCERLRQKHNAICAGFDDIILHQKENDPTNSIAISQLMDDAVLQFHNENLDLVTHDELDYQIRLESAYTQVRRAYEVLLFEAGMDARGKSFVGENPISSDLEQLRPGRHALLIQHLFDDKLRESFIARIAFRFLGCRFFSAVGSDYVGWSNDVKEIAKTLDLKSSLSLAPMGGGSSEGQSGDSIEHGKPPVDESHVVLEKGMVSVSEQLLEKVNLLLDNLSKVDIPAVLDNSTNQLPSLSDTTSAPKGAKVACVDQSALSTLLAKVQQVQVKSTAPQSDEKALSALAPQDDVRQLLKNALTQMSDESILTVIDRVSENIINLVCHLFQSITNNEALHPEASIQISRVQVPVIRLALTDSTMFRNNSHPARTYINNLGRLGLNVQQPDDDYLRVIKDSVERLLVGFTGSAQIFHDLNNELEPYTLPLICEHDGDSADEIVAPEQVLEFLNNQQKRIYREFLLHRFARIAWESLLSRIYHQSGINSKQWRVATAAYAAVVWSTQIDVHQESDKRQVLRRIPKIVMDVRELFKQYQLSEGVCETILNMMYDIHRQILQGTSLDSIMEETEDAFGQGSGPALIDVQSTASKIVDVLADSVSDEGGERENEPPPVINHLSIKGGRRNGPPGVFKRKARLSEQKTTTPDTDEQSHIAQDSTDEAPKQESLPGDRQEAKPEPMDLGRADQMIHQFRLGEFFELIQEKGEPKRYQLSHVSNILGVYYFREFGSKELLEVARPDLVVLIVNQALKKLSGASVFDDSLGDVLARIEDFSGADNQGPAVA